MEHLRRAIELSKASVEAGEFSAGAVLVMPNGNTYESKPTKAHYHGEMMVIDAAIEKEGFPLTGAVIYASMQPCLMCTAKMYWAGVTKVHYVIPKSAVDAGYAYEDETDTRVLAEQFFTPIKMTQEPALLDDAIEVYQEWARRIQSN